MHNCKFRYLRFVMHQSSIEEVVGLLNLHSETNPPAHSRQSCILNSVLGEDMVRM